MRQLEDRLEKEIFKLRIGDELQQGVMKLAKVYIAQKRKVSIGISSNNNLKKGIRITNWVIVINKKPLIHLAMNIMPRSTGLEINIEKAS